MGEDRIMRLKILSVDSPNANGNIIRTESFPNYGVCTPAKTYVDDSSGRFSREYDSSWGAHQIGFPHVGTGGIVYHDEYTEISFPSWEPVEETFEDIAKEFLYRKIKKHEEELFTEMYGTTSVWKKIEFLIDRVIFNEPATIILWKDGAKTVVKAQDGEPFDKEKGFLMAIAKYLNRDKANYNNLIKKWCPEEDANE